MGCVWLFSASPSISIASESAYGTEHLPETSVCACVHKVSCGETADWIRMPFGVVSGVGLGMGVLDFGGDRRRERGSFGVNLRRATVTKGDFVDNISVRKIHCWNICFIGFLMIRSGSRSSWGWWEMYTNVTLNTRKMADDIQTPPPKLHFWLRA